VAVRRSRGRGREARDRDRAGGKDNGLAHEERLSADPSRPAPHDDAGELEDELAGRCHGDGTLPPPAHHAREKRVARGHHEGTQRAHDDPVAEERGIADGPDGDDARQREGCQRGQQVVAKQQAATVGAIRHGAAQQHEDDGGRHHRHLGDAHALGRLLEDDGDEPREDDALYPEAGEPGGDATEVPAKLSSLSRRSDLTAQRPASQPRKPAASTSAMGGSQRQ
jgi:hypothetical protein